VRCSSKTRQMKTIEEQNVSGEYIELGIEEERVSVITSVGISRNHNRTPFSGALIEIVQGVFQSGV